MFVADLEPCLWNHSPNFSSRNLHCFTMLMDITSEAARELKTWDLRESLWSYKHLIKNDSLLHRILAPIEGQFNTSRGMELDVCFGSFRIRFPNSDWKFNQKRKWAWRWCGVAINGNPWSAKFIPVKICKRPIRENFVPRKFGAIR